MNKRDMFVEESVRRKTLFDKSRVEIHVLKKKGNKLSYATRKESFMGNLCLPPMIAF